MSTLIRTLIPKLYINCPCTIIQKSYIYIFWTVHKFLGGIYVQSLANPKNIAQYILAVSAPVCASTLVNQLERNV